MKPTLNNLPQAFDLNHQWLLFLKRCAIKEEHLGPDQKREMKRAFMGACGQMLTLIADDLGDYQEKHGDDYGAFALKSMFDQVATFWKQEVKNQFSTDN